MRIFSLLAHGLAVVGSAADSATRLFRSAFSLSCAALRIPRYRRIGTAVGALVLTIYLLSIGDIAVSVAGSQGGRGIQLTSVSQILQARAPYVFEPIAAVHGWGYVTLFVSPVNLLLGAGIAVLVAVNVAISAYSVRVVSACRTTSYSRLAGVLPVFLLGFACCAPTVLLLLGAGTAAALIPIFLPLRSLFYPLTIGLLIAALLWGTWKLRRTMSRGGQTTFSQ